MGKEVTIGLGVILILLITFGVVLARRLTGSADAPAASSSRQDDNESSEAEGDRTVKDANTEASAGGSGEPRVLAAKPVSAETPKPAPLPMGQWSVVSADETKTQSAATGTAKASPPSMMPNPPAPAWAEPRGRYGSNAEESTPPQTWQGGGDTTWGPTGDSQPYDPFPDQAAPGAAGDTGQVGQVPGRLRSLPPPRPTSRQSGGAGYGSPGHDVYPPGSSATKQPPPYRDTSQYSYPAQSQTAQRQAVPDSSFGVAARGTKDLLTPDGRYEVQPNDNYWVISKRLYGSGAYFKALAEHNRKRVPREDRLDVGEVISAPGVIELERMYPGLCPKPSRRETVRRRASAVSTRTPYAGGRTCVVEEGDTLFDIARYVLGKASRWVEIHQLNRDLIGDDPDYLTPGMQLLLPDEDPASRVTQRPRSVYGP